MRSSLLRRLVAVVCLCAAVAACSNSGRELRYPGDTRGPAISAGGTGGAFQLTMPALEADGIMPARYTSVDVPFSPALNWSGLPAGTRRLALVGELVVNSLDDQVEPLELIWLVINISANATGAPEGQLPADGEALSRWRFRATKDGGIRFRLFALAEPVEIVPQDPRDYVKGLEANHKAVAELIVKLDTSKAPGS